MTISRRSLVTGVGAAAVPLLAGATQTDAQTKLRPTGQETLGPYYPVRTPRSHDADLTRYGGGDARPLGQAIEVTGRVLDTGGRPLPQAAMTVWQANAAGRYVHALDQNTAPLDPNFLGVTAFGVSSDGRFRLRTIKPGAYPEPSGTLRTPHIHFEVTNADYRLITQAYFPGENLNATDILLSTLAARRRDPANAIFRPATTSEPGVLAFEWDIVLLT